VRRELGLVRGEAMLLHLSNLRALKRIDLLLATVAAIRPRRSGGRLRIRLVPCPTELSNSFTSSSGLLTRTSSSG